VEGEVKDEMAEDAIEIAEDVKVVAEDAVEVRVGVPMNVLFMVLIHHMVPTTVPS
jgi:hypothetical protein